MVFVIADLAIGYTQRVSEHSVFPYVVCKTVTIFKQLQGPVRKVSIR